MRQRLRNSEGGSILVLTAVSLVMLLGVTALAVDIGYMYEMRNRMSAAADAAALSATVAQNAASCACSNPVCATLTNFGADAVKRMGFDAADVTINHPPLFGPFAGQCSYVEAIVRRPAAGTFFSRVLGRNTMAVGARAVAGGGTDPPCIVILDTGAIKGIQASNGEIDVPGCTVQDSATGGNALDMSGGSINVTGPPEGSVWVSGQCAQDPSCNVTPLTTNTFHESQNRGPTGYPDWLQRAVPWVYTTDPCSTHNVGDDVSDTAVPTAHTGRVIAKGGSLDATLSVSPGPSGLGIICGDYIPSVNATLGNGIYVIYGGALKLTAGGIIINDTHDLTGNTAPTTTNAFFFTGASTGTYNFVSQILSVTSSGTINFKAPSTGPMFGIVFYADPANPNTGNSQISITGSGGYNFEGLIYMPKKNAISVPAMKISHMSVAPWVQYTLLIIPSLSSTGPSTLRNNTTIFSGAGTGAAVTKMAE